MRGKSATQATMLTAVTPDALVPQGHPIRRIKPMVDSALAGLSPTFSRMYASIGRPSIPPEQRGRDSARCLGIDEELPTEGGGRSTAGGRRTQSCGGLSWRAQGERDSRVEDGSRCQAGPQGARQARLCYEGHVLMDNRQGLVVDVKIA